MSAGRRQRSRKPWEVFTVKNRILSSPVFRGAVITVCVMLTVCALTVAVLYNAGILPAKKPTTGILLSGSAYVTDNAANLPEALKNVKISYDNAVGRIVPTTGSFTVKTSAECDTETLAQYMKVTPETPMSVTEVSKTEFRLTPASGFVPGTLYNITVGDPVNPAVSYAFQTENELCVKSILPADLAMGVPVNTGIEIAFSDSVKGGNLSDYIVITPSVRGSFMLYPDGRTAAFVPDSPLEYNKVYEVTVKAGITGISGKKLAAGTTVKFRTQTKESADGSGSSLYLRTNLGTLDNVFCTDENAYFTYSMYGYGLKDCKLEALLYKYPSADAAVEAIREHEALRGDNYAGDSGYDYENLTFINEYKIDTSDRTYGNTVFLGQGLEEGIYLVRLKGSAVDSGYKTLKAEQFGFIQISPLRAFTLGSDGKTLVYVNEVGGDAVTGATVSGVRYERTDGWNSGESDFTGISGKTGKDGTLTLGNGESDAMILKITDGDKCVTRLVSTQPVDGSDYFMKYIYTDREVYFSNDRVNFAGFVTPAYAGTSLPEYLYLTTGNSSLRTRVYLGEDGSFSSSLLIEDMSAGGIYLKLTDEKGTVVVSKYIRITEEEKPQIKASLEFDRLFYRYGEKMTVTLTASFFDGTPAPGFEFAFRSSDFNTSVSKGKTGDDGKITFTLDTGYIKAYSTDPVSVTVYAELIGMETQTLNISKNVLYFQSDYVFGTEYEEARTLTLRKRDTDSIKSLSDLEYPAFPGNTVGEIAQGRVSYNLIKYVITKTQSTRYDTYTKKTYTVYDYNTSYTTVKSGEYTFTDGKISLPMMEVNGFTGGYYYEISYNDGIQTYSTTVSAVKYVSSYQRYNGRVAELKTDKEAYGIGDTVKAEYTVNGITQPDVLYVTFGNGIHDSFRGNGYSVTFDASMLPVAQIYGVYFDAGNGKYEYTFKDVIYNYTDNAGIKAVTETDKASYKPGDTAILKIKTDAPYGTVLVSVVDEACFALGDQTVNIADSYFNSVGAGGQSLYRRYYCYYYIGGKSGKGITVNGTFDITGYAQTDDSRYSKNASAEGSAAETAAPEATDSTAGESSDYYIRKYFADNPEFKIVTLDKNGEGTLTFTVPDNITSWRVTCCAVGGLGNDVTKIRTGSCVSDMICTQPFFIKADVCSRYIYGDDIALSLRSYGSSASGEVKYTAVLYSSDGTEISTVTEYSECLKNAWINFGQLESGTYTIIATADCGEYRDALQTKINVLESGLVRDVRREVTADEIKTITPRLYPVTLTFYDKTESYGVFNTAVTRLSHMNDGERADSLVAKYIARTVAEKLYGTSLTEENGNIKDKLALYGSQYVSLLKYSEGDPELTAIILSVAPELLTGERRAELLALYEKTVSSDKQLSEERLCASLLGLAALNEPILDRLYSVADIAGNYSASAKLYLAAAFACVGDYPAAADIYALVKAERGIEDTEYRTLYFEGKTLDESIALTSLSLITSARISKTDAECAARYLISNVTRSESGALALATYLKFFAPVGEITEKTLEYGFGNGGTEKVTVYPGRTFTLSLTKTELESLEISGIDDGIGIRAGYLGTSEEANENLEYSDRVKISKTIKANGNGMYTVTLDISGSSTRVYESFDITDYIPSGARYFSLGSGGYTYKNVKGVYTGASIYNTSGQKMNGYVYVCNDSYTGKRGTYQTTCPEYEFSVSVSYVIRGAVQGNFISEGAVIENESTGIFNVSERYSVNINESKKWVITEK